MGMLKAAAVTVMITLLSGSMGSAVAQDMSQEKLKDVEDQLHEEQMKNEESKQTIMQLEKKVQCTYKLVKSYESCDASFPEKNAGYVACIEKARTEKDECLRDIAAAAE